MSSTEILEGMKLVFNHNLRIFYKHLCSDKLLTIAFVKMNLNDVQ